MPRRTTHEITMNRLDEDETEIVVVYTYRPGTPAHYGSLNYAGHPAEGPEIEIVKATVLADPTTGLRRPVDLTVAEYQKFTDWIVENHEDSRDPDDL